MEAQEAVDHIRTDPLISSAEKEFSIGFTKQDERATLHTSIKSQIKRALKHTDIEVYNITCYNEHSEDYTETTLKDYSGTEGDIVSIVAKVPIESLKVRSSPRSQRSYAGIISTQGGVDIQ